MKKIKDILDIGIKIALIITLLSLSWLFLEIKKWGLNIRSKNDLSGYASVSLEISNPKTTMFKKSVNDFLRKGDEEVVEPFEVNVR